MWWITPGPVINVIFPHQCFRIPGPDIWYSKNDCCREKSYRSNVICSENRVAPHINKVWNDGKNVFFFTYGNINLVTPAVTITIILVKCCHMSVYCGMLAEWWGGGISCNVVNLRHMFCSFVSSTVLHHYLCMSLISALMFVWFIVIISVHM